MERAGQPAAKSEPDEATDAAAASDAETPPASADVAMEEAPAVSDPAVADPTPGADAPAADPQLLVFQPPGLSAKAKAKRPEKIERKEESSSSDDTSVEQAPAKSRGSGVQCGEVPGGRVRGAPWSSPGCRKARVTGPTRVCTARSPLRLWCSGTCTARPSAARGCHGGVPASHSVRRTPSGLQGGPVSLVARGQPLF